MTRILGRFPITKSFGNFARKDHRLKNVFHSVPSLAKIQDGRTDVAVNSLGLVTPVEYS